MLRLAEPPSLLERHRRIQVFSNNEWKAWSSTVGASLPDEDNIRVDGRNRDDTVAWLAYRDVKKGDDFEVKVVRNGKPMTLKYTVTDNPPPAAP